MFEGLSDRLSGILSGLTRRGALTEADVTAAMREVRRALLEADVALEVVRGFTDVGGAMGPASVCAEGLSGYSRLHSVCCVVGHGLAW